MLHFTHIETTSKYYLSKLYSIVRKVRQYLNEAINIIQFQQKHNYVMIRLNTHHMKYTHSKNSYLILLNL